MKIIYRNKSRMFDIFERDGAIFMTAVTGGAAMYDVTIPLTETEYERSMQDEAYAIELAKRLAYDPTKFSDRLISPLIVPKT